MSDAMTRPSVRWAGIVWGALFALAASGGILLLALPDLLDAVFSAVRPLLFDLRPEWFGAVIPLGIGVLAIVLGAYFVIRRGRRGEAEPPPADGSAAV